LILLLFFFLTPLIYVIFIVVVVMTIIIMLSAMFLHAVVELKPLVHQWSGSHSYGTLKISRAKSVHDYAVQLVQARIVVSMIMIAVWPIHVISCSICDGIIHNTAPGQMEFVLFVCVGGHLVCGHHPGRQCPPHQHHVLAQARPRVNLLSGFKS
jgi:hypothetical protein